MFGLSKKREMPWVSLALEKQWKKWMHRKVWIKQEDLAWLLTIGQRYLEGNCVHKVDEDLRESFNTMHEAMLPFLLSLKELVNKAPPLEDE